jgi:DNA methylase
MLMWTDPPFGTGSTQAGQTHKYRDPSVEAAVELAVSVIAEFVDLMDDQATFCVCMDDRAIHHVVSDLVRKVGLVHEGDICSESGLGRPRTSWWPRRHVTIATFTKSGIGRALFDPSAVPLVARQAPKLGYPDTRLAGSCWQYTMSNTDPQRVDDDGRPWGYPNQKDVRLIVPFVLAHTLPGDTVVDPFMGSGSTGVAAVLHGREFIGRDINPDAVDVALRRIPRASGTSFVEVAAGSPIEIATNQFSLVTAP